jgi:hypothetical protein
LNKCTRVLRALALSLVAFAVAAADSPASRPDFTGVWLPDAARAQAWPAQLPLAAAARGFMEKFDAAADDPTSFCMPLGTPRNMLQTQFPLQIVQTPQRLVMILQPDLANAEVRRISFTGAMPEAPEPSWFGTSRGRWDGATLIIETTGLREDSIISGDGLPHSDKLRVVERLSIAEDAQRGRVLRDDIELHDPGAYLAPLRTRRYFVLAPQASLGEGTCVARKWIDKLWRDRLQDHAEAARVKAVTK